MKVRDLIQFYEDKIITKGKIVCMQEALHQRIVGGAPAKTNSNYIHKWSKIVDELDNRTITKTGDVDGLRNNGLVAKVERSSSSLDLGTEVKAGIKLRETLSATKLPRAHRLNHAFDLDNWYVKPSIIAASERKKYLNRQSGSEKLTPISICKPSYNQTQKIVLTDLSNKEHVDKSRKRDDSFNMKNKMDIIENVPSISTKSSIITCTEKELNENIEHRIIVYRGGDNSIVSRNGHVNKSPMEIGHSSSTYFPDNAVNNTQTRINSLDPTDMAPLHNTKQSTQTSTSCGLYKNHLYTGEMDVDEVKLILNCGERIKNSYLLEWNKR